MFKAGFLYQNITIRRYGVEPWIVAKGEIKNNSRKDYHSAVFRISVFDKDRVLWSGDIKIKNFKRWHTRFFEQILIGLSPKILRRISRHEIYFDSGY